MAAARARRDATLRQVPAGATATAAATAAAAAAPSPATCHHIAAQRRPSLCVVCGYILHVPGHAGHVLRGPWLRATQGRYVAHCLP